MDELFVIVNKMSRDNVIAIYFTETAAEKGLSELGTDYEIRKAVPNRYSIDGWSFKEIL